MAASEIDRYLADLPEPKSGTLEEMRRRILLAIPEAEQGLSYAVPNFRVHGKVVAGFAAFSRHLSYLPHSGLVFGELTEELADYVKTTGALHFAIDEPLPQDLIARLIEVKMRLLDLSR